MGVQPLHIDFGAFRLTSYDGSASPPAALWPEIHVAMALEHEPALLSDWVRRLQIELVATQRAARASAAASRAPKWTSGGPAWTILNTAPHMERKVAEWLTDEAKRVGVAMRVYVPIETYLPKTANVARSSRPWRPRTRPLIPGYVFAELPSDQALDVARSNANVRLMCREGRPVTASALAVGMIALFEAWGAYDSTRRASGARRGGRRGKRGGGVHQSRWKSGQRVKIGEGPFMGFIATIQKADREDRMEALIDIFGRSTPIVIDEAMIEEAMIEEGEE